MLVGEDFGELDIGVSQEPDCHLAVGTGLCRYKSNARNFF